MQPNAAFGQPIGITAVINNVDSAVLNQKFRMASQWLVVTMVRIRVSMFGLNKLVTSPFASALQPLAKRCCENQFKLVRIRTIWQDAPVIWICLPFLTMPPVKWFYLFKALSASTFCVQFRNFQIAEDDARGHLTSCKSFSIRRIANTNRLAV